MDSRTYVPVKGKILSIQARYDQEMATRKKLEMQRNYLLLFIVTSILAGAIVYGWRKKVRKEREDSLLLPRACCVRTNATHGHQHQKQLTFAASKESEQIMRILTYNFGYK